MAIPLELGAQLIEVSPFNGRKNHEESVSYSAIPIVSLGQKSSYLHEDAQWYQSIRKFQYRKRTK